MFYLNQFFSHVKKYPLRGFIFFSFGVVAVFFSFQKEVLNSRIKDLIQNSERRSYFYALVSSKKNMGRLQRKLRILPGVKKVQLLDSKVVQDKASLLLKSYPMEIKEEIFNLSYFGLKVVFDERAQKRAQQLIRDYLVRLVGEDDIILGAVKRFDPQRKAKKILKWIDISGSYLILSTLFFVWLLSGVWISRPIKRVAYLMEQFQRRSNIALKTYAAGVALVILLGTTLALFYGKTPWSGWAISFAFICISFITVWKKYQWND